MEPMKLKPAVKDYLWGGTRLREEYGVDAPLDKLAEAWMLSCHPQGEDLIENGRYQGLTLTQAIKQMGAACLGTHAQKFAYFPILIKLIDARITCLFRCIRTTPMRAASRRNLAKRRRGIFSMRRKALS
mgnify:CR=1 FL=1